MFDSSALLRRAYDIANGLFNIRYGIAYKMPLAQHPGCYASGFVPQTFSETIEWIRHRREWENRQKTPDELWSDELSGGRRHLSGLFRGAYPANILTDEHLKSADIQASNVGKLTKLDSSLWLWELSDGEIPMAFQLLKSRGVLVSDNVKT